MNTLQSGGFPENYDRAEEESLDLNYYIWMLLRGKWVILAFVLAGLLAAGYVNKTTIPVYRSSSTFMYTSDNSMSRTLDMPGTFWFQMDALRNDQIHLINSRIMAELVADSVLNSSDSDSLISILFLGNIPERSFLRNALVALAQSRVSVSWIKDTNFFVLSGTGYSPEASAVITNLFLHVYNRWNQCQARGENTEVRLFLEEQLEHTSNQLDLSESALLHFKEDNDITDIDTETSNLISTLANFETQTRTAATNAAAAQVRRDYLTGLLGEQRETVVRDISDSNNEYIRQIQSDLARYESARAALLADGADPHSEPVLAMEQRIDTRREELAGALREISGMNYPVNPEQGIEGLVSSIAAAEGEYRSSRAREQALRIVVNDLSAGLSNLPEFQYELVSLERNRRVNENIYILLRTRYEEVKIAEIGQMGNVTIVDSALPGGMIRPTTRRNLIMGIMVGLAAGIGIIFLVHQMDTSLRNPEQLEKLGIPIIGVIPKSNLRSGRGQIQLSLLENSKSPNSEAIRDLRTSLSFSRPSESINTLLVTSSGPQEGKSSVSANLAVAEAEAGRKVILLDCDLRRPTVNKTFGFQRRPGFSELITGKADLNDVIRKTEVEGLSIISSGHIPHNPAEIVEAAVRKNVFERIAGKCDLLIIDSPPAAVVTDAVVIAPAVDSVALVVRSGRIQKKVVQGVWQKLTRSGAHLSGAVINSFDPVRTYTSYSYYTYKYHYDYEERS
ncbi:MAG: polysaccharide biosynthesis tyrosine autokinase [Candidatus Sabulitectum sp.]|nr:polysaccharide biosynthesis tyrosine autokinase [Candidatus Sabulitectum sp.]